MTLLAHTITGDGPHAVLLLHGFLGSGRNLSTLARRWSAADPSLRIILPDLTGHGTSPPLPPHADLTTLAQDALALVHALGVVPHWVGHSLGGRVALQARLLDPAAVPRITLLDIAPGALPAGDGVVETLVDAPDHAPDRATIHAFLTARGIPEGIAQWLMMNLTRDNTGVRWNVDRQALLRLRFTGNTQDLWPAVESGGGNITVIRGGDSGYVRDEDVERLQRAGIVTHTLQNAGHFIHMDAPDALLQLLLSGA